MTIKPISPDEIADTKKHYMPDEVITTWNTLIAKYFDHGSAIINQDNAAHAIASALGIDEDEVFDNHYLDIEDIYRAEGWKVVYDKPGYNESYSATFKFSKK